MKASAKQRTEYLHKIKIVANCQDIKCCIGMWVEREGGQALNERFDYSQVDEITAKRLRGYEEEINVQMKRLGYAAHNIGIIKLGKQSDFIERVNVACDELGMERNFLIQAIARYLDGEVK